MAENRGGGADLLVIFGITGDLARRMTFRALSRLERPGQQVGPGGTVRSGHGSPMLNPSDHWNDLNRGASEASVP